MYVRNIIMCTYLACLEPAVSRHSTHSYTTVKEKDTSKRTVSSRRIFSLIFVKRVSIEGNLVNKMISLSKRDVVYSTMYRGCCFSSVTIVNEYWITMLFCILIRTDFALFFLILGYFPNFALFS